MSTEPTPTTGRSLTFTDEQLISMLMSYWFSAPPPSGITGARTHLEQMVQQEWLKQCQEQTP